MHHHACRALLLLWLYHRNSKLGEQLQALRKKEAEETKALEDMVAKVEENLVASTVSSVCVCVRAHVIFPVSL